MTFLQPLLRAPGQRWMLVTRHGITVATNLEVAVDSATRRRGLLGRDSLVETALILAPCNGVHTWFMRFAIDVLFVTRSGAILGLRRGLRPWRIAIGWRAFATIELPAGTIDRAGLRKGDRLAITHAAA